MAYQARNILALPAALIFTLTLAAPCALADEVQGRNAITGAAAELREQLSSTMLEYETALNVQAQASANDITTARVQGLEDVMYDGTEQHPTITLRIETVEDGLRVQKSLREGEAFDVEFQGDTTNPGTVSVVITAKGDWTGTITTAFTILPGDLSQATIDVIPDQKHTGDAITPVPTVKLNGNELTLGDDFTVTYTDNVAEGTASLQVTGTGNCTGDAHATFEIMENPDEREGANTGNTAVVAICGAGIAVVAGAASVFVVLRRRNKKAAE